MNIMIKTSRQKVTKKYHFSTKFDRFCCSTLVLFIYEGVMLVKQDRMEKKIIDLFTHNSDVFRQTLKQLYEKTHIIGAEDLDYEWCLVLTSKGKLKIYEQLNFLCELKGRSQILEYEYEILGQEYVNILDKHNYSKAIIVRLEEMGAKEHFISWFNSKTLDSNKKIENPEALRFKKAEELLFLLNQWNEHIYKEVETHIFNLDKENDMLVWLNEKMAIIESTINYLQKKVKHSI